MVSLAANIDTIHSDAAPLPPFTGLDAGDCGSIPAPGIGGIRQPVTPLSVFDGQIAAGRWTMFVYDYIGADMGIFGTWSLELTLSECPNQQPVFGRANNDFMSLIQDHNNNGNNKYAFIEFIGLNVTVSILTTLLVITMIYCICCGKLNKNKF